MRSMEDSQQKIATTVYRAGARNGPSFDSHENITEACLVTNPKLYFPLGQDLSELCKKRLEGIFLWEADVSTLGEGFTYQKLHDGVIKVEPKDSRNSKCTSKEIEKLLKSLKWQETTVLPCSGGLSLMDLSPLVQAVIVYMKDHYPSTPKELNFHAELKAASQWYWLEDKRNSTGLKEVPADDCWLKIAVRETLKTWEKEKEDLEAKPQRTDDSDEELSDAIEAIEILKNYLGEGKKDANPFLSEEEENSGTPPPPPPPPLPPREDEQDTLQDLSKLLHEFPYFVNRKSDELSLIVKCLDSENRECDGVFIDGAPGIGKTILATEAANKLRNANRLVAYIDCKDINSFESFTGTVIEQICRLPAVDDPAAGIKKRLVASKGCFYILFLDNFECFIEESNKQQKDQPLTAAAPSRDCTERVLRFVGEIARRPTNIKFLVTSSKRAFFPTLAMETIALNPFDKDESYKLLEKVRCADKISVELYEELCEICSGIPLVLHTLISLQRDLNCFVKLPPEERADFLRKMTTVPENEKIEFCLDVCFQRLTPQVQLTLLHMCLYRGLFTPDKVAKIFCSPESREHYRAIVLELGRCNLLHLQEFKNTTQYTFLTVIRDHFKLKAKQEYPEEIQRARGLLIDYLISFLKKTFKVFLGKNSVKSAIEEFSGEKENVMQLVEWIDNSEMDEERVTKCIDVFNVTGEMLAKIMAKFSYENVYKSLAKKCKEMGDQRRLAESLTSLGIKEIFNCICPTGLCDKAIERVRHFLDKADEIQTHLQVNKGNSRAQCLAKLGRCLVRSDDKKRGKAMIEDAIGIRKATIETRGDHKEEGGENVCYVMLGATYNDMAVALSFENRHQEAVNIRQKEVMPIYRERLGYHPFTATILNHLSNDHRDLKQFEAAEKYARKALRIRRELLADHRDTTKSLFDLGVALKANKKFREAKYLLEQCKTMQEKVVNNCTIEKKVEQELRDVNNRLLKMEQPEGQDQ